jgi:ribokinase
MGVVVFGSINMDLTTYVPRLPSPGETLFGHSFITVPGGKGSNQAVAAARLGAPTRLVGRVGDDGFGREVLPVVAAQGVDTGQVIADPDHGTGLAVISVDDRAENSIIVISGANMALGPDDVRRCVAALDGARVVLLQLEVPLEASLEVAGAARQRGVTVILDPAPAAALPDEVYRLIDAITPNEVEAAALVGFRPDSPEKGAQAAAVLRQRGVPTAIVKLGALGVCYDSPQGSGYLPAFAVKAIDTVAAGDAFNGGLAVALAEGKGITEAVRWGAAAGALATTRAGAMPSMPVRAELEHLLKESPTR